MAGWQKNRNIGGSTKSSYGANSYGNTNNNNNNNTNAQKQDYNKKPVSDDAKKQAWAEAELGALWQKDTADGCFYTGTINGVEVIILKNKNKKESKHPDFRVYNKEKYDALTGFVKKNGAAGGQNKPSYQAPKQTPQPQEKPEFDDSIDPDMEDLVF